MTKVAINGLGRIGRAAFKALLENSQLELVAINDLAPADQLAYLLNFDSVYGKSEHKVENDNYNLYVKGKAIRTLSVEDPKDLPWGDLGVELVLECTGRFKNREELEKHLKAGAKQVILSSPASDSDIPTIVHGVNKPDENLQIVSTASCTTNCITPVIEILNRRIGVKKAVMTTLHAYTASQSLIDEPSDNPRRGRAAALNFIPTTTGAARTTAKVLPEFSGRFDGLAVRGPVAVGSLADLSIVTERKTSVEEINGIFGEEAGSDQYRGILGVNVAPIVSSDIIMDPRASVVDLSMTQVIDGDLIKILAWYDNEWGYVNQMLREAERLSSLLEEQERKKEKELETA